MAKHAPPLAAPLEKPAPAPSARKNFALESLKRLRPQWPSIHKLKALDRKWVAGGAGAAVVLVIGLFLLMRGFGGTSSGEPVAQGSPPPPNNTKPETTIVTSKYPADKNTESVVVKVTPPEPVRVVEPPPKPVQPPTGPAPAAIDSATIRKVKKATAYLRVTLEAGPVEGSGFFAAEKGVVFTNAHVLGMLSASAKLPKKVEVVVNSGEPEEFTLSGTVLGVDRTSDLAILRVDGDPVRWPDPLPLDSSQTLSELQKVYIFGFPFGASLGKNITVSESSVSSMRREADGSMSKIQVNGGISPGNSGGPIADARGAVVGVSVSVISGTQINFGVPGEKVQALQRGTVTSVRFGEAYQENAQVKLPVRFECLDPLKRIQSCRAEVWTGNAKGPRPVTDRQPVAAPGDSTRQITELKYDESKAGGDVLLPTPGAGQVVWIQPALTDGGGATYWAAPTSFMPSELPPVKRIPATLQQHYESKDDRTVKLTYDFKVKMNFVGGQNTFSEKLQVAGLEQGQTDPRGSLSRLTFGSFEVTTEHGGKNIRVNPTAQQLLRQRAFSYTSDGQGLLIKQTNPRLEGFYPAGLRKGFDDLVRKFADALEVTCISVPNRQVQPLETWTARLPLTQMVNGQKQTIDLVVTCTYEGSRTVGGQEQAVISWTGNLQSRQQGQTPWGNAFGKAHFAVKEGLMASADVVLEHGTGEAFFAQSLHVKLTRAPGNALGITPARTDGPDARGKLKTVLQINAALTANDRADFAEKPNCHYKPFTVQMTAGQTYLIEMKGVGRTFPPFDSYLVLLDPSGKKAAEDDDSGGDLNSLILYQAPATGAYQIHATTLPEHMVGPFTLHVSEVMETDP